VQSEHYSPCFELPLSTGKRAAASLRQTGSRHRLMTTGTPPCLITARPCRNQGSNTSETANVPTLAGHMRQKTGSTQAGGRDAPSPRPWEVIRRTPPVAVPAQMLSRAGSDVAAYHFGHHLGLQARPGDAIREYFSGLSPLPLPHVHASFSSPPSPSLILIGTGPCHLAIPLWAV
jgi:hypothetical protein